jgi:hypothetical protein
MHLIYLSCTRIQRCSWTRGTLYKYILKNRKIYEAQRESKWNIEKIQTDDIHVSVIVIFGNFRMMISSGQ